MKQTSSHEFQPKRSSLLCLFNVVYITANTQFHKCRFFSQGPVGATGTGGFPGLRVSVICILVSQWRVRHYVILIHEIYSTRKLGFKNILTSLLFDKILSQFLYITEEKLSLWYFGVSEAFIPFASIPVFHENVTLYCSSLSLFWFLMLGEKSELGVMVICSRCEELWFSIAPGLSCQERITGL